MSILSIQSHVALGHVGNSAAAFALQRLGHEVWAVPTVVLSNHTGYPDWGGAALGAGAVRDIVAGLARRGVLPDCAAVLSGYMGDAPTVEAVLEAVAKVKAANGRALYLCDPVIGDAGRGAYVPDAVRAAIVDRAVRAADVITPNRFELSLIADRPVDTLSQLRDAAIAALDLGPRLVVVTSVETPAGLGCLTATASGAWLSLGPRVAFGAGRQPNGAGDLLAALVLARLLATPDDPPGAVARALASVHGVLGASAAAGGGELALVAAQDELVAPSVSFSAKLMLDNRGDPLNP